MTNFLWWHWLILGLGIWELLVWVLRTRLGTDIRINANPVSGAWYFTPLLPVMVHNNPTDDKDDLRVRPRKLVSFSVQWDVLCLHINITHTHMTEEGAGPMRRKDVKPEVVRRARQTARAKKALPGGHIERVEQPQAPAEVLP